MDLKRLLARVWSNIEETAAKLTVTELNILPPDNWVQMCKFCSEAWTLLSWIYHHCCSHTLKSGIVFLRSDQQVSEFGFIMSWFCKPPANCDKLLLLWGDAEDGVNNKLSGNALMTHSGPAPQVVYYRLSTHVTVWYCKLHHLHLLICDSEAEGVRLFPNMFCSNPVTFLEEWPHVIQCSTESSGNLAVKDQKKNTKLLPGKNRHFFLLSFIGFVHANLSENLTAASNKCHILALIKSAFVKLKVYWAVLWLKSSKAEG